MNNEEKILGILEKQGQMIADQGQMLNQINGRLDKMDDRMDTMQKQLDAVQETATRVAITQENIVLPRLQLLAEGHSTMMDMMPKKSRVEALEEDVAILKSAVEAHAIAISELKAAK